MVQINTGLPAVEIGLERIHPPISDMLGPIFVWKGVKKI
jgi:hypothetical protein